MVAFIRRPTLLDILTSSSVQYPYQPSKIKKIIPKVCLKMAGKCNHCPNISKKDHIVCTKMNFSFNMLPRPTKGISHANYPISYIAYHVQNALSNTLVSHREHYITGYKNTNTMFLIPLLSRHHSVNILLQKIME